MAILLAEFDDDSDEEEAEAEAEEAAKAKATSGKVVPEGEGDGNMLTPAAEEEPQELTSDGEAPMEMRGTSLFFLTRSARIFLFLLLLFGEGHLHLLDAFTSRAVRARLAAVPKARLQVLPALAAVGCF